MKKVISILMVLAMTLVLFAGCIWPLTFRWFGKWGKQRA